MNTHTLVLISCLHTVRCVRQPATKDTSHATPIAQSLYLSFCGHRHTLAMATAAADHSPCLAMALSYAGVGFSCLCRILSGHGCLVGEHSSILCGCSRIPASRGCVKPDRGCTVAGRGCI